MAIGIKGSNMAMASFEMPMGRNIIVIGIKEGRLEIQYKEDNDKISLDLWIKFIKLNFHLTDIGPHGNLSNLCLPIERGWVDDDQCLAQGVLQKSEEGRQSLVWAFRPEIFEGHEVQEQVGGFQLRVDLTLDPQVHLWGQPTSGSHEKKVQKDP